MQPGPPMTSWYVPEGHGWQEGWLVRLCEVPRPHRLQLRLRASVGDSDWNEPGAQTVSGLQKARPISSWYWSVGHVVHVRSLVGVGAASCIVPTLHTNHELHCVFAWGWHACDAHAPDVHVLQAVQRGSPLAKEV